MVLLNYYKSNKLTYNINVIFVTIQKIILFIFFYISTCIMIENSSVLFID